PTFAVRLTGGLRSPVAGARTNRALSSPTDDGYSSRSEPFSRRVATTGAATQLRDSALWLRLRRRLRQFALAEAVRLAAPIARCALRLAARRCHDQAAARRAWLLQRT